jgi:type VI secretion system protein ImpH
MANQTGNSSFELIEKIQKKRPPASFFQIRRLIDRFRQQSGLKGKPVRVRPSLSTEYTKAEVVGLKLDPDSNEVELLTTFLGLYGASSPLPGFYTEELIKAEAEDNTTARALLDIIHERLYTLFYEAQRKYRPLFDVVENKSSRYATLFFGLLGINPETIPRQIANPHRLLRYISLFSQQPRSALGLKTVLEDMLSDIPVQIEQCSRRFVKIPINQRSTLGNSDIHLGENYLLGEELEDRTGKIVISLGPLDKARFQSLMHHSEEWTTMVFLIQSYLNTPFDCEVEFILKENQAETTQLGRAEWSCLGRNAWLFSQDAETEIRSRYVLDVSQKLN